VYNQVKYLEECVNSFINQTYGNIEVILVDDGSNDGSERLCDKYATEDSRFRVIHKKNGGLVSSWKVGVTECKTEFLTFVDSDDWISRDFIKCMVDEQVRTNSDLVVTHLQKAYPDGTIIGAPHNVAPQYYDRAGIEADIYPKLINTGKFQDRAIRTSRCGKLIKTDMIRDTMKYVNEKVTYEEDLNTTIPLMLSVSSLSVIENKDCIYYVRQNPMSMTHSYDKNMLISIKLVYNSLEDIIKEHKKNVMFMRQLEAEYLDAMIQHYKNMLLYPRNNRECINYLRKEYKDNQKLRESIKKVNWKGYRKLNKIIIFCMYNYNSPLFGVITLILRRLKLKSYKSLAKDDEKFRK